MKKLIALILALAMVLALTACGGNSAGSGEASAPSGEGESASADVNNASGSADRIVVSSSQDGTTFDPFAHGMWGNCSMSGLIFQSLAYLDADKQVHLELAKSIEKVDDTHYAIELWDNIFDTAGNQITSADVVWTFEQSIANGDGGSLNRFDHFEVIDDYNLVWVCSAPFTAGEYEKNICNALIVSKASYESTDFTTNPIGTGPYKLKDYTVGSTVVLEKNEDFWRLNNPDAEIGVNDMQNFQEIEYQIIQDASSRAMALEMNTIDIADSLNGADVKYFESMDEVTAVDMPVDAAISFTFNCSEESLCSSLALRQAVCYALDNAAIAEGLDVPATPAYGISPLMLDAPEEWTTGRTYYDYDTDTAKALLAEAGYKGEELVMIYQSNTAYDGTAVMMQSQLKEVGINLKLEPMDMTKYIMADHNKTAYDIKLEIRGGGSYLAQVLKSWTAQEQRMFFKNGENNAMVADPTLDELYNKLQEDNSPENIAAWDNRFTFEMCYGYAIATYFDQTAARSNVQVALGDKYMIWPNACSFT